MKDFDYDCLERKRLARQAKYRKRGSKSRKCPMSTDHMTQKQWKERCGAIVSITIGKPVTWDNFKEMSKQTQEEYLKDLMGTYGANATSLATMFGIQPLTVRRYIASKELDITFPVGHSMNSEQRAAWECFLSNEPSSQAPAEKNYEPQQTNADSKMSMSRFSLSFDGKIDVGSIANSLHSILGGDASGRIEIICDLAERC